MSVDVEPRMCNCTSRDGGPCGMTFAEVATLYAQAHGVSLQQALLVVEANQVPR